MQKDNYLKNRIKNMSEWLSLFLIQSGYHIDYDIESYKEIDRFFDEKMNLMLSKDNATYIFSIASYIGEVLKYSHKGKWFYNNTDTTEKTIYIKLNNNKIIYPFELVSLRIKKEILIQDIII